MVKKAISEDPSLAPVFKDSPTLQVLVPQPPARDIGLVAEMPSFLFGGGLALAS